MLSRLHTPSLMKCTVCFLLLLLTFEAGAEAPTPDEALVRLVGKIGSLTRVTKERVAIRDGYVDLCEPINFRDEPPKFRDHATFTRNEDTAIHVYVSPEGAAAFKEPATPFPI